MKYLIPLLALAAICSCKNNVEKTDEETAKPVATSQTVSNQDTQPFPVYLTFDEFEHHLRQQNDTTYVVNFWATWCKPCVAELPWFEQLIKEYENKPVKVLLVSMDFPKQIKSKLIPFVEKRNLESSVVALADMDYNAWIEKVSPEWDGAIPFSIIYKKEKQKIKLGEMDGYEELHEMLLHVME